MNWEPNQEINTDLVLDGDTFQVISSSMKEQLSRESSPEGKLKIIEQLLVLHIDRARYVHLDEDNASLDILSHAAEIQSEADAILNDSAFADVESYARFASYDAEIKLGFLSIDRDVYFHLYEPAVHLINFASAYLINDAYDRARMLNLRAKFLAFVEGDYSTALNVLAHGQTIVAGRENRSLSDMSESETRTFFRLVYDLILTEVEIGVLRGPGYLKRASFLVRNVVKNTKDKEDLVDRHMYSRKLLAQVDAYSKRARRKRLKEASSGDG